MVLIRIFNIRDLVIGDAFLATFLLFLLFGLSVAAFTYMLTYCFRSHSTAQTSVLVLNLLCVILLIASFVMSQLGTSCVRVALPSSRTHTERNCFLATMLPLAESTCKADLTLRIFYRLLPGFAFGDGLLQLSLIDLLPITRGRCGLSVNPVTLAAPSAL